MFYYVNGDLHTHRKQQKMRISSSISHEHVSKIIYSGRSVAYVVQS